MSDTPTVDQVAADILADQRTQAQREAALAKATIAVNAKKASEDSKLKDEHKFRLFKCTFPNSQYITRRGKTIPFTDGIYITDDVEDIAELEYELSKGHLHIYVDKNMMYVDETVSASKLSERARIKEEVKQELLRDMGFTPNPSNVQLGGIKSTRDIESMTEAGNVNQKLLKVLQNLPKATG